MKSSTPRGSRLAITLLGRRNAGKSKLLNALCEQDVSIVSEHAGTTTDPVLKHYELIPLGPVSFYDTAGIDDSGELGELRVKATKKILQRSDMILFVIGGQEITAEEKEQLHILKEEKTPCILVYNKVDLAAATKADKDFCAALGIDLVEISALTGVGIDRLKESLINLAPDSFKHAPPLIGDLIAPKDVVICVIPIDLSAPKGRLILPQVQVLRELLDYGVIGMVTRETELEETLAKLSQPPALVVTDSQAVQQVSQIVPNNVPLTTFSTLYARYKGDFPTMLSGVKAIDSLKDGSRILVGEACSHHVVSDDIGKVKLPAWLKKYTDKDLLFDFASGYDFPDNLEQYDLVIHCGACMLNRTEMVRRINFCSRRAIPVTNYDLAISKLQGVLDRIVLPLNHAV